MSAHPKCTDGHVCQEPSGRTCIAALDERCVQLTRAAEARDRGAFTTNDPRGTT